MNELWINACDLTTIPPIITSIILSDIQLIGKKIGSKRIDVIWLIFSGSHKKIEGKAWLLNQKRIRTKIKVEVCHHHASSINIDF